MRLLDLFSGIGGFSLAAEWTGAIQTIGFSEIDSHCRKVLEKNFPGVPIHGDIRNLKGADVGAADIISGGFPCQPFSVAGKRGGTEDDRYLWPPMLRIISEVRPTWVLAENVDGLVRMGIQVGVPVVESRDLARTPEIDSLRRILTREEILLLFSILDDLEALGYGTLPLVIPACGVDAPHLRYRLWIVAHAVDGGSQERRAESVGSIQTERGERDTGKVICSEAQESGACKSDVADALGPGHEPGRLYPRPRESGCEEAVPSRYGEDVPDAIINTPGASHGGDCGWGERGWENQNLGEGDSLGGNSGNLCCDVADAGIKGLEGATYDGRCTQTDGRIEARTGTPGGSSANPATDPECGPGEQLGTPGRVGRGSQSVPGYGGRAGIPQSELRGMDDGIPERLDGGRWPDEWEGVPRVETGVDDRIDRLRSLGNAIVPQVAFKIFKAMVEAERHEKGDPPWEGQG